MAVRRSTQRYVIWGLAGYLAYHFYSHPAHRK